MCVDGAWDGDFQDLPISFGTGKRVELIGTNCNKNPAFGFSANYADPKDMLTCALVQVVDYLPAGGTCVEGRPLPHGGPPRTCYQTNSHGCMTTYCAVDFRRVDPNCTHFLDDNAYTTTRVGC